MGMSGDFKEAIEEINTYSVGAIFGGDKSMLKSFNNIAYSFRGFPSQNEHLAFFPPFYYFRTSIFFVLFPVRVFVPFPIVIGLSVLSLKVIHGIPNAVVSSCNPQNQLEPFLNP